MRRIIAILIIIASVFSLSGIDVVLAYTDGTIKDKIEIDQMMDEILESLADHTHYSETKFTNYSATLSNSGYFGTGSPNEAGIRAHVNYTMVYAVLYKYLPIGEYSRLPEAINTRDKLKVRVMQAITYAIGTHETTGGTDTPGTETNDGNTPGGDAALGNLRRWGLRWQSSMWSGKLGFACKMMWDELEFDEGYKTSIEALMVAEANKIMNTNPPYAVVGDTRAEENSWDTNIVSLAYSMFPNHANAASWDYTAKRFAVNTLTVGADRNNTKLVDGRPVSQWFAGANIYDDYSMENHNIFHPVYQTSALLAFADSILYYKVGGNPVPEAFSHNVQESFDNVLKKILLPTGAWAFPNGNDWSLDSLDQIDALALMSTYFNDSTAKLAVQRAWQFIRARQDLYFTDITLPNFNSFKGSYIGHSSDTEERRESIQAERIAMTYLLHKYFGNGPDEEKSWNEISAETAGKGTFVNGNIIYDKNPNRFASFSWANGLYMGTVIPDSNDYLDKGLVSVPYHKAFVGQYLVDGVTTAATAARAANKNNVTDLGISATGLLREGKIDHYLSFATLPDNGVVFLDIAKATSDLTVNKEQGIPISFRTDELCGSTRKLYYENSNGTIGSLDRARGNTTAEDFIPGSWANVDGQTAMIVGGSSGIRYGDYKEPSGTWSSGPKIKSAGWSTLYGSYSAENKTFAAGDEIANRSAVVYSNIDAEETQALNNDVFYPNMAEGWNGIMLKDTDEKRYFVASNFFGGTPSYFDLTCSEGAPILPSDGVIEGNTVNTSLNIAQNNTSVIEITAYVKVLDGETINAMQGNSAQSIHLKNDNNIDVAVQISITKPGGDIVTEQKVLGANKSYGAEIVGSSIELSEKDYNDFSIALKTLEAARDVYDVKLTWTTASNISDSIIIERKTGTQWQSIATVSGFNTRYIDTTVAPSTAYQYRLSLSGKPGQYITSNEITLPQLPGSGERVNVAEGKTATAFNAAGNDPTNPATNRELFRLTDGVTGEVSGTDQFWGTRNGATDGNEWRPHVNSVNVTIDLGEQFSFKTIAVVPRTLNAGVSGYGPRDMSILVYEGGEDGAQALGNEVYETVKEYKSADGTGYKKYDANGNYDIDLGRTVTARYVRLNISLSYDTLDPPAEPRNVALREIMVFEELPPVRLSKLTITAGVLSPRFFCETENYSADVVKGTEQVSVLAETLNTDVDIKINNALAESGTSFPVSLNTVGALTPIKIELVSKVNSSVLRTYTVNVNSNNPTPCEVDAVLETVNNQDRVLAEVMNYSDSAKSVNLIIAVYNGDAIDKVYFEPNVAVDKENHAVKYLGRLSAQNNVKVMVWDDLTPLSPAVTPIK